MRQLSRDTGVPYSTLRAWQNSRYELINYIETLQANDVNLAIEKRLDISYDDIAYLQTEIAALEDKLNQVHKLTEV